MYLCFFQRNKDPRAYMGIFEIWLESAKLSDFYWMGAVFPIFASGVGNLVDCAEKGCIFDVLI
jgi:hypothetical protein